MRFLYVYAHESQRDGKRYIGLTHDLKRPIESHRKGGVLAAAHRQPLVCIYAEAYTNEEDARRREKYLKTSQGNRFLAKRLLEYYRDPRRA